MPKRSRKSRRDSQRTRGQNKDMKALTGSASAFAETPRPFTVHRMESTALPVYSLSGIQNACFCRKYACIKTENRYNEKRSQTSENSLTAAGL